jgi:hypothetical protein
MTMPASSPITDPATYPGEPVSGSCVVTHEAVYSMTVTVDAWTVDVDGENLEVDAALARIADAAPLSHRRPVLAIGSNASAAQLRRKWRDDPHLAVPVTAVQVTGIGIGHSPHVSRAGYVPYVPRRVPGMQARYYALWLTASEIRDLDATEPNYEPTVLDGEQHPAVLESEQRLDECVVYRGRWGVLGDETGAPVPAGPQVVVMRFLRGIAASNDELAADPQLRTAATSHLATLAVSDGLDASPTL